MHVAVHDSLTGCDATIHSDVERSDAAIFFQKKSASLSDELRAGAYLGSPKLKVIRRVSPRKY